MMLRASTMAAVIAAALLPAGCGIGDSAAARIAERGNGAGEIVIGAAWPWEARQEIRFRQGLEMAVDEVNAAGGVHGRPLRVLFEDDGESVNRGLLVAQRLASNPEVAAVIGHLQSYVTVPAASIYESAGIVMVSPTSTEPTLTNRGYRRVFRTIFTDAETGREMARYAGEQGYRRVAIYYVRSAYGRALANAFEEHAASVNTAVVTRASFEPAASLDPRIFEPTLRQWAQLEIDAVFLAGEVPLAGHLIAAMRRLGLDQPILGGDAMSLPALIEAGGDAAEGTVVIAAFHADEPRPEVQRFTRAFRERFNADPDPGAALAYDALMTLARALEHARSAARDELADAMRRMPPWNGVTGPIEFNDNGDLRSRDLVKLVVRNGRFEPIEVLEVAHRD